jgi:spore germination cell wall hydrolase CwlJ-like protein
MNHQQAADLAFLALTVWREARGEQWPGKVGVAHSILNRVKRPGWWGSDISSVVFKRLQYSSLTYPKDLQLTTWPKSDDPSWRECLEVAAGVIDGTISNPFPGADSYHDISIPAPAWATIENFCGYVGRLRFHDVDQDYESETLSS